MKRFVEIIFSEIQSEVRTLKVENCDLKQTLQFSQTEIVDLKKTVNDENNIIGKLKKEIPELERLDERVCILDDVIRKNNVIIEGVSEVKNENNEQTPKKVQTLISEKAQPGY